MNVRHKKIRILDPEKRKEFYREFYRVLSIIDQGANWFKGS